MDVYVVYNSDFDMVGYSGPLYAATSIEAAIQRVEAEVAVSVDDPDDFAWQGDNDLMWYSGTDYWVSWWVKRLPVEGA